MPSKPYTPAEWLMRVLAASGAGSHRKGQYQCPAHADSSPSLSVGAGRDGQALIHCQAGCGAQDVLAALQLGWADLRAARAQAPEQHAAGVAVTYPPLAVRHGHPAARGLHLESVHDYDGHVLERWRGRDGHKEMAWFTRGPDDVLVPGLMGTPTSDLPLYREREVRMAAAAGEVIAVVESESSVDALNRAGIYATTWAGGAANPNVDRLVGVLAGARVLIVPDNDVPGLAAGRSIWRALNPVADVSHALPAPTQDARELLAAEGPAAFHAPPGPAAHDQSDDTEGHQPAMLDDVQHVAAPATIAPAIDQGPAADLDALAVEADHPDWQSAEERREVTTVFEAEHPGADVDDPQVWDSQARHVCDMGDVDAL